MAAGKDFNPHAQGRSIAGTRNILRTLHAMFEDAITDEVCELNPVAGVVVRQSDPRATRKSRKPNVYTFEQMHALAAATRRVYGDGLCECGCGRPTRIATVTSRTRGQAAGKPLRFINGHKPQASAYMYEAMCRVLSDCMVRLGEMLATHRTDHCAGCDVLRGPHLHLSRNAHNGVITEGDTPTKKHVKIVPLALSTDAILKALPPRLDSPLMFPAPEGGAWTEADFYRKVWRPARAKVPGMEDARPHDFRHSGISQLRAALGESHAPDLAAIAGHDLETMNRIYTHPLGGIAEKMRQVVG